MILASFSLDWFMTIPGMLITGGVVFLIIALIIFIATGNKKPKTNKEVQAVQEASKQEAVATASQTVTPTPVVPTNNQVVTPQPVATEAVQQPVQPNNQEVEAQPTQEPQMWHCPNCDKDVSGKFCSDCGAKRPERRVCSNCGNVLQPANKFCPECGTPVEK